MLQLETRENGRQPLHSNQNLPLNLSSPSSVCLGGAGREQAPGRRCLYLEPTGRVLSMTGQMQCPELWGRRADGIVHLSKAIKKMCWFLPFLPRLFTQSLSSDKIAIPSPAPRSPAGAEHSCEGQPGFLWVWSVSREKWGYQQKCLGAAVPNAASAVPVSPALHVPCVLSAQPTIPASACHQAAS